MPDSRDLARCALQLDRGSDWGAVMAGSMIAIVPALIVFLLAQKQLVRGIAMSGLKG